jgi:hypothetical protein
MSAKTLPSLLDKMWQDYIAINPLAKKIHDLFQAEGEVNVTKDFCLHQ